MDEKQALLATKTLEALLNDLADNETEQHKIYNTYRRAAEADLYMRALKDKEKSIRIWMNAKMGM